MTTTNISPSAAPIIAIYIGDELYPTATYPFSEVQKIIQGLQLSPLTCPIVSMVNVSSADANTLVYNEADKPLFDLVTGNFIGPQDFVTGVTLLRKTKAGATNHINHVYLSFGTGATTALSTMTASARSNLLSFVKTTLACDGIDLDYEGGDYSSSSPIYPVAAAAIAAGLKLTAAPYDAQEDWGAWVKQYATSVAWLNLQCYSGGSGNDPKDWLDMGTLIVPGLNPFGGSTTPKDMQHSFARWEKESASGKKIAGGFIWSYAGTGSHYLQYINAVKNGLSS